MKLTFDLETSFRWNTICYRPQVGSSQDKVKGIIIILIESQDDLWMSDRPRSESFAAETLVSMIGLRTEDLDQRAELTYP